MARSQCHIGRESDGSHRHHVQILREIRDGKDQNMRLDQTNVRLDRTRDDMKARFAQMELRQPQTEIRLAAELVAIAAAVHQGRDELRKDRRLRARVDDHERRIGLFEKGREEAAH
jgi:hypothetical protein